MAENGPRPLPDATATWADSTPIPSRIEPIPGLQQPIRGVHWVKYEGPNGTGLINLNDPEMTAEVCRRWNSHDTLVAALKATLPATEAYAGPGHIEAYNLSRDALERHAKEA